MEATIPMSNIAKGITCEIRLTGVKVWWIRFKIGTLLLMLAVKVIGMKGKVIVGDSEMATMEAV